MVLTAVMAAGFMLAASPSGPMQTCTAQWQAQGLSRAEYKPFLSKCLAGQTAEPVVAGSGQGNRMKLCGARWQKLKASGKTQGQSWRQFSKTCLRNP